MEKIVDKIRKLLAKAGDSATTEAEAAAFAAKAHELMMAHELSEEDVVEVEDVDVIKDGLDVKYAEPWRRFLADSVAQYYLCTFISSKAWDASSQKMRPRLLFLGRRARVAIVKEMYLYLEAACVRLAKSYSKDREMQLAFERGCGVGLSNRLDKLTKDAKAPPVTGGTSGVPALYQNAAEEIMPLLASMNVKQRLSAVKGGMGFGDGMRAAANVSLGPQVGSSSGSAPLLKGRG